MYWFKKCLKQYADFQGRARRMEYWMFNLFVFLISMAFVLLIVFAAIAAGPSEDGSTPITVALLGVVWVLFSLGMFIPNLAVLIRRLHDIGKSGWFFFISFVPFVGGIVLLIFLLMDSKPGDNQYGPNPKQT